MNVNANSSTETTPCPAAPHDRGQPGDDCLAAAPNFDKIPPDLRARPQWVVWRQEEREGKPTKIPYQPRNPKQKASSTNPDTWGTFEQALSVAQTNGFHGIGYAFSPQDDYAGVDLDHCRDMETGEIEPWAMANIDRLQSYTEKSPSGTGLHILIKGKVPNGGNKKGQVEMYSQARYFTMSGAHLEGTPTTIEPRQAELEALHKEVFGKPSEDPKQGPGRATKAPQGGSGNLPDDELIRKITESKIGEKFRALWENDSESGWLKYKYGYSSQSEADLALCSILAFWTGKDAERMDRLFRKSGLLREKWNEYRGEQTYGELTIAKAIVATSEVWKGAKTKRRAKRENKTSAPGKTGLPQIRINDRQLRDSTAQAVAALHTANDPPEIFVRLGELVRIQADEDGRPIIKELSEAGVRYCLTQAADFVRETKKEIIQVSPPRDLVQNTMASPDLPFPPLRGIVEVPALRPDGSILATPGYDSATRLYYRPAPGLTTPQILMSPSQKHAIEAARFLYNDLLGDFPFVDNASHANALAALMTPIVRHAIPGRVPAGINTATKAGTGKTMMQEMIGAISTGKWTPMYNPPGQRDNDAEWSKVITAALLNGSTIVCFDNVDGLLQSPSLSSAITTKVYRGRILGLSKIVDIPVNVSWFINGNNVRLGGDLPRRCYWIRLDAKMSRPWERKGFKHKDLGAWVMENQGQLITALLTMARAWYVAGCPKPNTPKLGSFESWCDTIGGILQFAGITDFLGNQEKMYELSDVEGQEWEMFLLAWQERYGDAVVLVKELVDEIQKEGESFIKDTLPTELASALTKKGGSLARTLGWALPKREGTQFGDSGVHLIRVPKADLQTKANGWKVLNSLKSL